MMSAIEIAKLKYWRGVQGTMPPEGAQILGLGRRANLNYLHREAISGLTCAQRPNILVALR